MLIVHLKDCPELRAGDNSMLREILHPDKTLHPDSNDQARATTGPRYSLAHATVPPGKNTIPHRLKTSEVYYILQGRGRMHIDNEISDVNAGDAVYIPPYSVQHISNTGDRELIFLCIVDPAWREEDEEIF